MAATKRRAPAPAAGVVRPDLGADDERAPAAGKPRRRRHAKLRVRIGADHSIEIRHAGDASPDGVLCREAIELADAASDDGPRWIQIAKVGSFRGHPAGPFALTPETFEQIVANFRATENKAVPIDFEHASEADPTSGSVPVLGAPAQGWIRDLDNRGTAGLWGLVEWLPQARTYIRDGAYRYLSPAIRFGARDRVTGAQIGARLTSAALTNQPFLDGMAPLAAKDSTMTNSVSHSEMMPQLRAALRLDELAPPADMKAKLANLRAACMAASDPLGTHEGVDLGGYVGALRTCMNAPASWQIGELFDAVESLIHAAIERHEAMMHGPHDEADEGEMSDAATSVDMTDKPAETPAEPPVAEAPATVTLSDHNAAIDAMKAERDAMRAELDALKAERDALRVEVDKRLAADREREVDEAIATHGRTKGIGPQNRAALLRFLCADADGFRSLYPRQSVAPEQRYLTQTIVPPRDAEPSSAAAAPSIATLADKYRREGKSNEQAIQLAYRDIRANLVAR